LALFEGTSIQPEEWLESSGFLLRPGLDRAFLRGTQYPRYLPLPAEGDAVRYDYVLQDVAREMDAEVRKYVVDE